MAKPLMIQPVGMRHKYGQPPARRKARSEAQRLWGEAMGLASTYWDHLTDEQRLSWNTDASTRRSTGQRQFVKLNARRCFDGEPPLVRPPQSEAPLGGSVLRRLLIGHRRGRMTLKLELAPAPGARFTVWGSRPMHRGCSRCYQCPRLGPLPPLVNGVSDFTALYFQKHGPYIRQHRVMLAGKRIFIRLRQELDGGPSLYKPVDAVVPGHPNLLWPPQKG